MACAECAERGVIIRKVREHSETRKRVPRQEGEEKEVVLVDDYGRRIREGRERLGMSIEDLAKRLRVREGYLHKIEEGELTPTDGLARKLEKLLGIQLFEEISEDEVELPLDEEGATITLGDVVKLSWRRKE